MNTSTKQIIAFDARYINDRYHGIGRHAYNLLDALSQIDMSRHYIAFYNPDYPNTRFDMERLKGRSNLELRAVRLPLYSPKEQFAWPFLLARAGAQLFHSPYIVLPMLARIRMLITVHDLIFEHYPEYRPQSYLQKFYGPVTRMSIKRADLILTVSRATSCDIQEYYHVEEKRIRVIRNAIDATFCRIADPMTLLDVRTRYSLPEHFILTVGAGRPHKNVETLVDAFACLDASLAPRLVIGGERDPRFPDAVGARIAAHGIEDRVVRLGMIREADLPAVYSLADVFVFPSLVEGFGLPPLEAMACGTPVIASATPSVAEVVGDAGLVFEARDIQQLVSALKRVLADDALQATMRQRGLERVHMFKWERVARETLKTYASIEALTDEEVHSLRKDAINA
jgi:glycosyltransferase involved in cell wall biosynthesis